MKERLSQMKPESKKSRKKKKLKYSDSDENSLDSEKSYFDFQNETEKDNIFLLFSFDRQYDYMERVKRLHGKIMTKGLFRKIEEKMIRQEGRYYFSEEESEEDGKKEEKEKEEEKQKEALNEKKFIFKQNNEYDQSLFSKDSPVLLIETKEEDKIKSEGLFNIIMSNDSQSDI